MSKRLFNSMVNYALYGYSLDAFKKAYLRGKNIKGLELFWQYAKERAYKVLRG